jgi:hypothetical protein
MTSNLSVSFRLAELRRLSFNIQLRMHQRPAQIIGETATIVDANERKPTAVALSRLCDAFVPQMILIH